MHDNRQPRIYDVIGIGFGPSNLALAIALQEEAEKEGGARLDALFLEGRSEFAWHPGMLLKDAQMQISFLKDLVTLRNPQSRFTFINYLKSKNRLNEFVNLREFYPNRNEFNDYLGWAAGQLEEVVRYGTRVLSVHPVTDGQGRDVDVLEVVAENIANGEISTYLTCNLVVAGGGLPRFPSGIEAGPGPRVFHSHEFLPRLHDHFADTSRPYRFVVVGSGQSAAEIFHHLIHEYGQADVTAALRPFAYKPADDSSFVNEIFFPQMVDFLFDLPEAKRRDLYEDYADTNYSVVDLDLIQAIYKSLYEQKVAGADRFRILPFLHLAGITEENGEVTARFRNNLRDTEVSLTCDAVILATGYERSQHRDLLRDLDDYLLADAAGEYLVSREYRVHGKPGFAPAVYLQGYCEPTHGLSDTLLSILPIRSAEIVESLLQARNAQSEQVVNYAN